jgi:hypothetical protein
VLRLSLRYPNGRSHDLDYDGPQRFHVGHEFDLYGRRWRVIEMRRARAGRREEGPRIVTCVPLTGSALRVGDT